MQMLQMGKLPSQILAQLQVDAIRDFREGSSSTEQVYHPSLLLTLEDIENARKRMLHCTRVDSNDVVAVEKLTKELGGACLYYKPQEADGDIITEHLRLAICTDVQRKMLKLFGSKLFFMDAVWGLSRYGFPVLALVVRDELGHGFPCAYCIASAENSVIWQEFLEAVLAAADVDPTQVKLMIDKSTVEMAAIRNIGSNYLLCFFHMLQDWQKYLQTSGSGVHGKTYEAKRGGILKQLCALHRLENREIFEVRSRLFEKELGGTPRVLEHYMKNWRGDAEHWAAWGRKDVASLESNTNNLIERHFRTLKYTHANGTVCARLDSLVDLLLRAVMTFTLTRQTRLQPGERSRAEKADKRLDFDVSFLSNPENAAVKFLSSAESVAMGEAVVRSCNDNSRTYTVVVADGSCQCLSSLDRICKHVEAASSFPGQSLTVEKVKAGAEFYRKHPEYVRFADATYDNSIRVVVPLAHADPGVRVESAALLYVNMAEQQCSCKLFGVHGACPHLLAVLEEEQSEAMLATLEAMEGAIPLQRRRRIQFVPIVDEPTCNCEDELRVLLRAPEVALGRRYAPSETVKLGKARCSDLATVFKKLPLEKQRIGPLKIEELLEDLAKGVPQFTRTRVAAQKAETKKNKRGVAADRRKIVALQPSRMLGKSKRGQRNVLERHSPIAAVGEKGENKKKFVTGKPTGTASHNRVVTKKSNRKKLRTR